MKRVDTTSTRASLWFSLLAGPTAWTLHELASYVLVKLECASGLGFVLHVATLGALALAGAGAYVAVGAYATDSDAERKFLAGTSLLIDGLFTFAILMEWIPATVVSPCL